MAGDRVETADTELRIETPDWYDQTHHRAEGGFQNIWGNDRDVPALKAIGWLLRHSITRHDQDPAPTQLLKPEALEQPPDRLQITWLGHSTAYVQFGETRVLLDPMFSGRASPVRFAGPSRLPPLPLQIEDLPGVDIVVISHDHYDHLDETSIRQLEQQFSPVFVVPLDVGEIIGKWGARRVVELDWWQHVTVGNLRLTCTPAQHFSGRGLTNRDGTLWAGWYLEHPADSTRLFYAGDTGYADLFKTVRERLGAPHVALLPIGAYLPRWFMSVVHVDPEEALQAFVDLGAEHMIPVHWGTFNLAGDPVDEAPRLLREAAERRSLTDRVHILDIGAGFSL